MIKDINIIIPLRDEEEQAEITVLSLKEELKDLKKNFVITLIDDHSRDSTWDLLNQLKAKHANVEIFKNGKNKEKVVNKSKTTGEPPLMNAMSVFFAIKDAISSIGNYNITPVIDAPATPEKILMSIKDLKAKL